MLFFVFPQLLSIICENMRVRRNWLHSLLVTTCTVNQCGARRYLSIQAVCFFFQILTGHVFTLWPDILRAMADSKILLFLFHRESTISLFCLLYTHTGTHWNTWLIQGLLFCQQHHHSPSHPLSPWRQASRAGWFQTVVNQHRLKREGEGGGVEGSLCV